MRDMKMFFRYVIPSVFALALSGVYAIVDGFFVGNSVGDVGLSAINVAYPVAAVIQAAGTGIGMGGAVNYSIRKAENREKEAQEFMAGAVWLLFLSGFAATVLIFAFAAPILKLLGAADELLTMGESYVRIISYGAALQIIGTGLVPFIRNSGSSVYAMVTMAAGFVSNIALDYWFVWVRGGGISGAAWATIISQGVTLLLAAAYLVCRRQISLNIQASAVAGVWESIVKIGIAPFGLSMTPNISLMIINRFSVRYGGERAVAVYACVSYIICIIYLILQGVGDGCQPLMSLYYGRKASEKLREVQKSAYGFSVFLSAVSCAVMYAARGSVGDLFGASAEVSREVGEILPIFLVSVPFVAVSRVTTSGFYATAKSALSYVLTFVEPVFMLVFMLVLPPLSGGQAMVWWSTVYARIITAVLALWLKRRSDRRENVVCTA